MSGSSGEDGEGGRGVFFGARSGQGVLPVPHLTVFTLQVVREPNALEKVRGLEVSSSYLSRTGGPSEDGV